MHTLWNGIKKIKYVSFVAEKTWEPLLKFMK